MRECRMDATGAANLMEPLMNGFRGSRVVVVGDLILDRYIWGDVTRISPEAPVPVLRMLRTTHVPGGAANVALNLRGLDVEVSVVGYVGADADGDVLCRVLQAEGIRTESVIVLPDRPTITKTRVMGGKQQMLRMDMEDASPVGSPMSRHVQQANIRSILSGADVVVLSDYAKGVLSAEVCEIIIDLARERAIPVVGDPKGRNYGKYTGATALTPNRAELALATGTETEDTEALITAGERLREQLELSFLVFTQGEEGMTLLRDGEVRHFPAGAREVFDVSGAGDTVIATLAAGIAANMTVPDALTLANYAAGIVVGKVGTAPISMAELYQAALMMESAHLLPVDSLVSPESRAS